MNADELIERFKVNDYSRFEEFYKETSKQVYFTALGVLKDRALAEDVMQDTYVAFLDNVEDYKRGSNIFAYLSVIARNKSINLRKRDKRMSYDDDALKNVGYEQTGESDGVEEILSLVDDDTDREIIVYHVLIGYKFAEIAKIMSLPLGTALWRYNRAMKKLRAKAERDYE